MSFELKLEKPPFDLDQVISLSVDWDRIHHSLSYMDEKNQIQVEVFETEQQLDARKLEILFNPQFKDFTERKLA